MAVHRLVEDGSACVGQAYEAAAPVGRIAKLRDEALVLQLVERFVIAPVVIIRWSVTASE